MNCQYEHGCGRKTTYPSGLCWSHDPAKAKEREERNRKISRQVRATNAARRGESPAAEAEEEEPVVLLPHVSWEIQDKVYFLPPVLAKDGEFLPAQTMLGVREDHTSIWMCPFCLQSRVIAKIEVGYCDCGAVVVLDRHYFPIGTTLFQLEVLSELLKGVLDNTFKIVGVEPEDGHPSLVWRLAG